MKKFNINKINNESNNIFDVLLDDIYEECTYGLEYIIDDILRENKSYDKIQDDHSVDWFGLNDLCL